jgi:hypothetical protein
MVFRLDLENGLWFPDVHPKKSHIIVEFLSVLIFHISHMMEDSTHACNVSMTSVYETVGFVDEGSGANHDLKFNFWPTLTLSKLNDSI